MSQGYHHCPNSSERIVPHSISQHRLAKHSSAQSTGKKNKKIPKIWNQLTPNPYTTDYEGRSSDSDSSMDSDASDTATESSFPRSSSYTRSDSGTGTSTDSSDEDADEIPPPIIIREQEATLALLALKDPTIRTRDPEYATLFQPPQGIDLDAWLLEQQRNNREKSRRQVTLPPVESSSQVCNVTNNKGRKIRVKMDSTSINDEVLCSTSRISPASRQ